MFCAKRDCFTGNLPAVSPDVVITRIRATRVVARASAMRAHRRSPVFKPGTYRLFIQISNTYMELSLSLSLSFYHEAPFSRPRLSRARPAVVHRPIFHGARPVAPVRPWVQYQRPELQGDWVPRDRVAPSRRNRTCSRGANVPYAKRPRHRALHHGRLTARRARSSSPAGR